MSPVDMSPTALTRRLQLVGELADLDPERRLELKLDLTPEAITRRLRRVSELRRLCIALGDSRLADDER